MSRSQPPYPAAFRQQVIELVRAGRNPAELAREFGCNAPSIRNCVAQSAVDGGKPPRGKEGALTSAAREQLSRLRRQVRQLQMERDTRWPGSLALSRLMAELPKLLCASPQ